MKLPEKITTKISMSIDASFDMDLLKNGSYRLDNNFNIFMKNLREFIENNKDSILDVNLNEPNNTNHK